ncbi:MAG: PD40 domain-containing protein [Planctomycetes bacterium]|nr:PD40 domain-containing protein [Planctomycetota bacterium]MBL7146534.1 PD40 domain-containing protein [Phycisphaerae bacterium]
MKQTKKKIVWLVVFWGVGSIQVFGKPFAEGPYLGQTPPGPIAKVFAPGLICDTRPHQWETWGSFSSDGNSFCFFQCGYVYITENTDQGWTVPKRIKSIPYKTAAYCCLSPDANSIYCAISKRDPRIKHYDLYRCDRTARGWTKPQRLGPPLSSQEPELGISIAADNSIYFGSGRKGGDGRSNIHVAPFVDKTWPRAVHIFLNHAAGEPGIAPDESFMVFTAINLPGGYGQRDLYLTMRLPDGTWSPPQNLGPRINSAYFEFGPRISPDKKYLFFTRSNGWWENSNRDTSDIYWVELKEYLPESYR